MDIREKMHSGDLYLSMDEDLFNEQLTYLKEINCDYIQGFLLSKPMDTEHLEQLIIKLL